jgi:hypothetical protein
MELQRKQEASERQLMEWKQDMDMAQGWLRRSSIRAKIHGK